MSWLAIFADLDTHESDVANLDELLTPLNSGVTAAEYLFRSRRRPLHLLYIDQTDWWEGLRVAVADSRQPKKSALEKKRQQWFK